MFDLFTNASSQSHLLTNTVAWSPAAGKFSAVDTLQVNSLVGATYTLTGSEDPTISQKYNPENNNIEGMTFKFRVFIASDLSSHASCQLFMYDKDLVYVKSKNIIYTETSSAFTLFEVPEFTFPDSSANLVVRIDPYQTNNNGDTIRVLFPHLIVDNEIVVLQPEYDYKEKDRKVESRHRTKSGAEFVYKFGDYKKRKLSVMYVDSSDKYTVNGWWNNNTDLIFMGSSDTDVNSVRLTNKETPIGIAIKPYTDLFKGVIELETY